MLHFAEPVRPSHGSRQSSHRDASTSSRCTPPAEVPHHARSSEPASRTGALRTRRQPARQQRLRPTPWLDPGPPAFKPQRPASPWCQTSATGTLMGCAPSAMHPAQLTALIQGCQSVPEMADVIHEHGEAFNEIHVMCAVSRLSNLRRRGPSASSSHSGSRLPWRTSDGDDAGAPNHDTDERSDQDLQILDRLLPLAVPHLDRFSPRLLSGTLSSLARMGAPPAPAPLTSAVGAGGSSPPSTQVPQLHAPVAVDGPSPRHALTSSPPRPNAPSPAPGQAYWAVVHQLLGRSIQVMHEADADQGCHILWAAAKLGCPRSDVLVAAATCMLRGAWTGAEGPSAGVGRVGGGRPGAEPARGGRAGWATSHSASGVSGGGASERRHVDYGLYRVDTGVGVQGAGVGTAARDAWPVPPSLAPMLLWSLAHSSASQLCEPEVAALLGHLLDPGGGQGSLVRREVLESVSLQGLVTALYAVGLMHETLSGSAGGGGRGGDDAAFGAAPAAGAAARAGDGDGGDRGVSRGMSAGAVGSSASGRAWQVSPETVDVLCDAIVARASEGGTWGGTAAGGTSRLTPREVSNALLALSRLQHPHCALSAHLVAAAEQLLAAAGAAQGHPAAASPRANARGASHAHQGVQRQRLFTKQEVCNSVMAIARLRLSCPGVQRQLGKWLRPNAARLGARDVGELLFSLAILNQQHQQQRQQQPPQQPQQPQQRPQQPGSLQPAGLARHTPPLAPLDPLVTADGRSSSPPSAGVGTPPSDAALMNAPLIPPNAVLALADAASRQLDQLSPRHVVGVLWDLARLQCPHPGIAARVAACLLRQAGAASAGDEVSSEASHASAPPPPQPQAHLPPLGQLSSRAGRGLASPGEADGRVQHTDPLASLYELEPLVPLDELEPNDLARLCSALASPRCLPLEGEARVQVLDLVASEATEWCPCMSDQELVVTLEAFACLQHPCPLLLEAACPRARQLAPSMAPSLLVRLAWCLARLEGPCSGAGGMAGLAARDLLQELVSGPIGVEAVEGLSGADVLKLCWAYAFAEVQPGHQLLERLASSLCQRAPTLSPQDLGTACWALARLYVPPPALQRLAEVALAKVQAEQAGQADTHGPSRREGGDQGAPRQSPKGLQSPDRPTGEPGGERQQRRVYVQADAREQQQQQQQAEGLPQGSLYWQPSQPPAPPATITPSTLATIAFSLAQSRALPGPLLSAIVAAALRSGHVMRAADAAQLLWALSVRVAPGAARQNPRLLQAVTRLVEVVAGELRAAAAIAAATVEEEQVGGDPSADEGVNGAGAGVVVAAPGAASASARGLEADVATAVLSDLAGLSCVGGSPGLRGAAPGPAKAGKVAASMLCVFAAACAALEFSPGEAMMQELARQLLPHVSSLPSKSLCHVLSAMALFRVGKAGGGRSGAAGLSGSLADRDLSHSGVLSGSGGMQVPEAEAALEGSAPQMGRPGVPGISFPVPEMVARYAGNGDVSSAQLLVGSVREVLTRRLCVEQLEVLSLGNMVRLAWALACRDELWWTTRTDVGLKRMLRMVRRATLARGATERGRAPARGRGRRKKLARRIRPVVQSPKPGRAVPRLLVHAAARAFASPPGALTLQPLRQRQLQEVRLLLQAECRPRSTWRALSRRWAARQAQARDTGEAAAAGEVEEGLQPVRAREEACALQVLGSLTRLDLASGARWVPLAQGDNVCLFKVWPEELRQAAATLQGAAAGVDHDAEHHARATRASPPVSFAACLVSERHMSCDASRQRLAGCEIRARFLHRRGFRVLEVHVDEWLGMGVEAQQRALLAGMLQCAGLA